MHSLKSQIVELCDEKIKKIVCGYNKCHNVAGNNMEKQVTLICVNKNSPIVLLSFYNKIELTFQTSFVLGVD